MTLKESDVQPNREIPLAEVFAGSSYDARWAFVPADVDVIDRLEARYLGFTWNMKSRQHLAT